MAVELSSDETFFNGLINDPNFEAVEKDLLNEAIVKPGKRTSRKPGSPKTKVSSRGKENVAPKQAASKRVSRKSPKEPLKLVVVEGKSPKKKTKEAASPAGKRKSVHQSTPSPVKVKKTVKNPAKAVPKIVVYEDPECRQEEGEGEGEGEGEEEKPLVRKRARRASKSVEGRKSLSDLRKGPKAPGGLRRSRHSFNDLSSLKSPKKEKPTTRTSNGEDDLSEKVKPRDPEFAERLAKLEMLFPGIDPEFLRSQFVKMKGSLTQTIEAVLVKEKSEELPTRADYVKRTETEKLQQNFLEKFSVEAFLKMIPDPWDHFLNVERQNCIKYSEHSLHYLKNKFKKHYMQAIQDALVRNDYSLYLANKELNKKNRLLKMRVTNRSKNECDLGKPLTFDAQFIHEVAFIENEMKIKMYLKKAEMAKQKQLEKAEKEGTLLECHSCSDLRLLPDDAVRCPSNHVFCKDCITKYAEMEAGSDHYQFKCLMKCEENLPLEALQAVLSPVALSGIIKRNKMEDTKPLKMEDLHCCPFCYCVVVVPPEMSILKCLNPSCLKESCRHCKQLNHIPLKCYELEDLETTLLMESETETSLKCNRCSKDFVKREDSIKMECPCGATMCSVCRQPFSGCPHSARLDSVSSSPSDDTDRAPDDHPRTGDHPPDTPSPPLHLHFLPSSSESF